MGSPALAGSQGAGRVCSHCCVSPVLLLYILLGTVTALVGMLAAGAALCTYWVEIVLLYRTYRSEDKTLRGKGAPAGSDVPSHNRRGQRGSGSAGP